MQVSELAEILSNHDNDSGCLYINNGYDFNSATIDCVYYREDEVVLQSNEIEDTQEYSPTIAYIQHCLNWFDSDDDVCVMICDEDNDYVFYDITDHYIDGDGDLFLYLRVKCG